MYRLFFVKANFVTGAQIQLISKASGHSLHIVQDPSGELVVEGKGDIGPQAWNGTKNSIKIFHNHNTYHIFQSLNNLFFQRYGLYSTTETTKSIFTTTIIFLGS